MKHSFVTYEHNLYISIKTTNIYASESNLGVSHMTKQMFSETKIRDFQQISGLSYIIFIGLCLIGLCSTPAMAGTKYLSGEPDLSITIAGLNEFTPGTTIELPVLIENSG